MTAKLRPFRHLDSYEFRQYETAMSVKSVSLESKSTESGYKDFIAVGTTITRGEDLASRGAVSSENGMSSKRTPG